MTSSSVTRVASVIALCCAACQAQDQGALGRAVELLAAKRYSAAASALRQAQQHDPSDPNVYLALGLVATCTGDFTAAKSSYLSALTLRTGYAPAHNAMGLLMLKLGDLSQAHTYFRNAVRFDPTCGEARVNLAYTLCLQGVAGQAVEECRAALQQLPHYPFAREVAATASILLGDFTAATGYLGQLVHAVPTQRALVDLNADSAAQAEPEPEPPPLPAEAVPAAETGENSLVLPLRTSGFVMSEPLPPPVTVSEVTVVTAGLAGQEVRYVAFLIDGVMRAVTNRPPYRWEWNTRETENGPHVVTVQAYRPGGLILSQEFRHVVVENSKEPPRPQAVTPTAQPTPAPIDPDQIARRLRELLRVKADPLRPRRLLAATYEEQGLTELALDEYTRLFLEDRSRTEAHDAVLRLRRQVVPSTALLPTEVWSVADCGQRVALTFDDGPRPYFTDRVLEILRKHQAKGTFFMVGKMAAAYPSLVQAIEGEGHELANHSYNHPNLATLSTLGIELELLQAESAIREACKVRTHLFRPPGGNYNGNVCSALKSLGYLAIFWGPNITSWKGRPPEEIAAAMARQTKAGDFLLLHNGRDETVYVLDTLLEYLERRGFEFVTVSQLLASGRPLSTGRAGESNEY